MRTLRTGEGVPGVQGSGDCEDDMAAGARGGACVAGAVCAVSGLALADSNEARLLPQHTAARWWTGLDRGSLRGLVWAGLTRARVVAHVSDRNRM
jgi:hypothetical protein